MIAIVCLGIVLQVEADAQGLIRQDPDLARLPARIAELSNLDPSWTSDGLRQRPAYGDILSMGPKAIPQVLSAFTAADTTHLKVSLAFLLSDWNALGQAVEKLTQMMSDPDPVSRAVAASIMCYADEKASIQTLKDPAVRAITAEKQIPPGPSSSSLGWLTDEQLRKVGASCLEWIDNNPVLAEAKPTSVRAAMVAPETGESLVSLTLLTKSIRESERGHAVLDAILANLESDPGLRPESSAWKIGLLGQLPWHKDRGDTEECDERARLTQRILAAVEDKLWSATDPYLLSRCHSVLRNLAVVGDSEEAKDRLARIAKSHPHEEMRALAEQALKTAQSWPRKHVEPVPTPNSPPEMKTTAGRNSRRGESQSTRGVDAGKGANPPHWTWILAGTILLLGTVALIRRRHSRSTT